MSNGMFDLQHFIMLQTAEQQDALRMELRHLLRERDAVKYKLAKKSFEMTLREIALVPQYHNELAQLNAAVYTVQKKIQSYTDLQRDVHRRNNPADMQAEIDRARTTEHLRNREYLAYLAQAEEERIRNIAHAR